MSEFYENDDDYTYEDDNDNNADDYEYKEDEDEDEIGSPPKLSRHISATHFDVPVDGYRVVNILEVQPEMQKYLHEISSLLAVSSETSELLLQCYNWNVESLTSDFFVDSNAVYMKTCITQDCSMNEINPPQNGTQFKCNICLSPVTIQDSFALPCNHYYCRYYSLIYFIYHP